MTVKATFGIYEIELIGDRLFVHQNNESGFSLTYLSQPGDFDKKILDVKEDDCYYPLIVFRPKGGNGALYK